MKKYNLFIFAILLFLLLTYSSYAGNFTWDGSSSTTWTDSSNWTTTGTPGVPSTNDTVTIVTNTNQPLLAANTTIKKFTMTSGTLDCNSYTLTISATATFNGGTINNGTITCSGTSTLTFAGTIFGASVSAVGNNILFNGSVFNSTLTAVKKGTSSDNGTGGNVFNGAVNLTDSSSGNLVLSNNSSSPDTFNAALTVASRSSGSIYLAHQGTNNVFNGKVTMYSSSSGRIYSNYYGTAYYNDSIVVNSTSSGGEYFGMSTGSCTVANNKTISIGTEGFNHSASGGTFGTLYFHNFYQSNATAINLTLTGSRATIKFEPGCLFYGNVTVSAPGIFFDGCRFLGKVSATYTTGSGYTLGSAGGNYFGDSVTVIQGNAANVSMGVTAVDTFATYASLQNTTLGFSINNALFLGNVKFKNSLTNNQTEHYWVASTGSVTIKGTATIENANSTTLFGSSGGNTVLDTNSTLSITSGSGKVQLWNVVKYGTNSTSISMSGSGDLLYLNTGNVFNGPFYFSGQRIFLNGSTFNGTVNILRTSATTDACDGGNVFNGTTTVICDSVSTSNSNRSFQLATVNPDDFNGDVTFKQYGSGSGGSTVRLYPAYTKNSTFAGNVTVDGSSAIEFGANGGKVIFDGSGTQALSKSGSYVPSFKRIQVNKSAGIVSLGYPLTLGDTMFLTKGVIATDTTNLLTVPDNGVVSGGSDSAYINGPLKKIGNDAFIFALGDTALHSGAYHSFGISAPSSTSDVFTARYYATGSGIADGDTLDSLQISTKEYWSLKHDAGSSSTMVTLRFNGNVIPIGEEGYMVVARDNGSSWSSLGNSSLSSSERVGTIVASSSVSISSGSMYKIAIGNSIPPINVTAISKAAYSVTNDDGKAYAFATDGIAPINFSWNTSPGQASPLITGLSSGSYTVTVVDAWGYTDSYTVSVGSSSLPPPPVGPGTSSVMQWGTHVNTKNGSDNVDWAENIKRTNDGGYIACGNSNGTNGGVPVPMLYRLDRNGNLLWWETYPIEGNNYFGTFLDVIETTNGGFAGVGYTEASTTINGHTFDKNYRAFIIVTDALGVQTSGNQNNELLESFYQDPNSVYISTCGGNSLYDVANSILEAPDGEFVVAGVSYVNDAQKKNAFLVKTDGNTNTIAAYGTGYSVFNSTANLDDAFTCMVKVPGGGNNFKIYVAGYTVTSESRIDDYNIDGTHFCANCGSCITGGGQTILLDNRPIAQVSSALAFEFSYNSANNSFTAAWGPKTYSNGGWTRTFADYGPYTPGFSTQGLCSTTSQLLENIILHSHFTSATGVVYTQAGNLVISVLDNFLRLGGHWYDDDDNGVDDCFRNTGFPGQPNFYDHYSDGDCYIFEVNGGNGSMSGLPSMVAHFSGEDFHAPLAQDECGNLYVIGTTADNDLSAASLIDFSVPDIQNFLVCKFDGVGLTKVWRRTLVIDDNFNNNTTDDGDCAFGIAMDPDNSFIVCGNDNTRNDDAIFIKMSCDFQRQYTGWDIDKLDVLAGTTYTISGTKKIRGPITVQPTAFLDIINADIEFAETRENYDYNDVIFITPNRYENSGITVLGSPTYGVHAGIMKIRNSTLKGMQAGTCNRTYMWDGIAVEGDPSYPRQATPWPPPIYPLQGTVEINYNTPTLTTIQDARCGVRVDSRSFRTVTDFANQTANDDWDNSLLNYPYSEGHGGGIVQVYDPTLFLNCRKGVEFLPYRPSFGAALWSNVSGFAGCEFKCDARMVDPDFADKYGTRWGVETHVSMWGVHWIFPNPQRSTFWNCTFSNVDATNLNIYSRGNGITSADSKFRVSMGTNFNNLTYGIYATAASPFYNFAVDLWPGVGTHNSFDNNVRGILAHGILNAKITSNDFKVGNTNGINGFLDYGVYMQDCGSFRIEGNSFLSDESTSTFPLGLINYRATPPIGNDNIYKNSFDNFKIGTVAMNKNKNGLDGLRYECNEYGLNTVNDFDQVVTGTANEGIKPSQGLSTGGIDNKFNTGGCSLTDGELYNIADPISYYYDDYTGGGFIIQPQNGCYTNPPKVTPIPTFITFNNGTMCQPHPAIAHQALRTRMDNDAYNENQLREMIDGGNTEDLLEIIEDGDTSDIKNALAAASPFLSEDVLKATINQPALTAKALREILLPSAQLTNDVIAEVDDLPEAKRDSVHDMIDTVSATFSPMDTLQAAISFYRADRDDALNELVGDYLEDTTGTGIDSVIDVLKNETSIGRQWQLACAYLYKDDWSSADSVFDILDNDTAYTNFCKLQRLLHDYSPLSTANPDSLVPRLDSIANDSLRLGYIQARSAIFAITGRMYPEYIVLPEESSERRGRIEEKKFVNGEKCLLSYPNPTSGIVTIECNAPVKGKCFLVITDIFGRLVKSFPLKNEYNKIIFDSSLLNAGVYFENLICDTKIISTTRLLKTD